METPLVKQMSTFNKHQWHLKWPRFWISILGFLLILLALVIVGMEIGHTVFDVYRSTAFGGFILFIPFMICGILVIITGFRPRLAVLRVAIVVCIVTMVLCVLLIDYDIFVLLDPTRCFFLDCNYAQVVTMENTTVTGWPLNITWTSDFQRSMNAKRIFQSAQLFSAALFILFCSLFILTFVIYRNIDLYYRDLYDLKDGNNAFTDLKGSFNERSTTDLLPTSPLPPVSMGNVFVEHEIRPSSAADSVLAGPVDYRRRHRTVAPLPRAPAKSAEDERLCTRCMEQPRMMVANHSERKIFFSPLCRRCNEDQPRQQQQ